MIMQEMSIVKASIVTVRGRVHVLVHLLVRVRVRVRVHVLVRKVRLLVHACTFAIIARQYCQCQRVAGRKGRWGSFSDALTHQCR